MSATIRPVSALLTAALLASVSASACSGHGGSGGTGSSACSPDDAIMKGLAPTCAGCHTQGSAPFFASLTTFETLLAWNPKYVVPGHPEQSTLVSLLQGQGTGTYKQMPLAGDSFATLAAAGKTQLTLAQVEDWVTTLSAGSVVTTPNPAAVSVQRVSVEQIRATLYAQLGLSDADFFKPAESYGIPQIASLGEDNYPFQGTDQLPGSYDPDVFPVQREAALGGSQSLAGRKRDLSPSPPFAHALVALSQRWCKMAIAKPATTLLFPYVDSAAKSATSADAIKKNLAYLNLHFLGQPADPADIDDVFQSVFVPLEAESDPPTAWAGVCSYFIRHPRWVFY